MSSSPLQSYRLIADVAPAARAAAIVALLALEHRQRCLVICAEREDAEQLVCECRVLLEAAGLTSAWEVVWLPQVPDLPGQRQTQMALAAERLSAIDRLRALDERRSSGDTAVPRSLILASLDSLCDPFPDPAALDRTLLRVRMNDVIPHSEFVRRLGELDYDAEAQCEAPGQYALRGGLVDVYPVTADAPVRIDFFGNTVEDIREFDPVTQRSGNRIDEVTIAAAPTVELQATSLGIASYLGLQAALVLIEPLMIDEGLSRIARERSEEPGFIPTWLRIQLIEGRSLQDDTWYGISELDSPTMLLPCSGRLEMLRGEALSFHRPAARAGALADSFWEQERDGRARFFNQLEAWRQEGWKIVLVLPREGEEQRAREILTEEAPDQLAATIDSIRGALAEGLRIEVSQDVRRHWPSLGVHPSCPGLILVTEAEFFGRRVRPRVRSTKRVRKVQSQVDQMLDFADLAEGDLVVHLHHGVGIFRGVQMVDVSGQSRESIAVEFDEGVRFYVPLHESHLLTRYVGVSKTRPTLGKLGSGKWERTRAAAERSALDLAAQLLSTQAARETRPGYAFPPDNNWQHEFEASFPHRETPDQVKVIGEVKTDMEKQRPMDRLVCGDVGFGKTEIAIRAAFKAVMGGRQVAVLVPTTVLAQQHLNNFRERMSGFPVSVEMISRFRTSKEQKSIAEAAASGRVDVLIGTHRLLSEDIRFRDLGLVIIDEEQRFGVKHKERLKEMRAMVDVLSMSATPIPRTLYLALTGARDLSVIETPPAERLPIKTVVKTFDLKLIEEAIRFEVRRGGQVFYLHNRVDTIETLAAKLRELLPDLSIAVGHGQMREHELERIMTRFVSKAHQVLVCTTIIESGIDIPNCNTIIIEGADRFGLSQLYQIRGRVGRFREQAYAYLLLHRHARLMDVARQRLTAIRQHNELGAGFRIAMRDLELRGAGNLLGPEQSGHIVGVGFDLYCQLLRQSVARLKGDKSARWVRATLKLDFLVFGSAGTQETGPSDPGFEALQAQELEAGRIPKVEARIPAEYIAETRLRLDFYRRLALADSARVLKELEAEMQDRFGKPPRPVKFLILATEIRCRAEQKGLQLIEAQGGKLKCLRASGRPDDYVMIGSRFPRLTEGTGLSRLREILVFITNLPDA